MDSEPMTGNRSPGPVELDPNSKFGDSGGCVRPEVIEREEVLAP